MLVVDMRYIDQFSEQAALYAVARPTYPDKLFSFLAGIAPSRRLAWDCATGSGQAAIGLARHFDHIIATDASEAQIAQARQLSRVEYRVAPAERSGLPDCSCDLVTVAQALHWFDLAAFYGEVRRVLAPGGILAAWCYLTPQIDRPIDKIIAHYWKDIVGPYWAPQIRFVEERYATIPFPFRPVSPPPRLVIEVSWTLRDLLAYIESWSSTQRYRRATGADPLVHVMEALARAWGPADGARLIGFPLSLRVGATSRQGEAELGE